MDEMSFDHEFDGDDGVFYLRDNGDRIGKIRYQHPGGNRYVVDYVEVDPAYRDRGFARRLVDKMANFARDRGFMIAPTCSVVASIMNRHSEYHDVLEGGGEEQPRG